MDRREIANDALSLIQERVCKYFHLGNALLSEMYTLACTATHLLLQLRADSRWHHTFLASDTARGVDLRHCHRETIELGGSSKLSLFRPYGPAKDNKAIGIRCEFPSVHNPQLHSRHTIKFSTF